MEKVRQRLDLLKTHVPELFSHPGTILYVGAHTRQFFASLPLWKAGNKITILEVWQPFIDALERSRFRNRYDTIIQGDVTNIELQPFDYVLWFHGPEHIKRDDFEQTVNRLENVTKKTIVITCPFGVFRQGVFYGNPHTEHKAHYMPDNFMKLGYQVATLGKPNKKIGQLQAWKRK